MFCIFSIWNISQRILNILEPYQTYAQTNFQFCPGKTKANVLTCFRLDDSKKSRLRLSHYNNQMRPIRFVNKNPRKSLCFIWNCTLLRKIISCTAIPLFSYKTTSCYHKPGSTQKNTKTFAKQKTNSTSTSIKHIETKGDHCELSNIFTRNLLFPFWIANLYLSTRLN